MIDEPKKVFSVTLNASHLIVASISAPIGAAIAMLTHLALSVPSVGGVDCFPEQITIIRYRYGEQEKICIPPKLAGKVKATLKPPSPPKILKNGGP